VVVADDSALMRKKLREILAAAGDVEVLAAVSSGEAAVEAVAKLRPDAVTMDLEMPGQGGLWAIGEIMRRAPTPVVVVSSLAQPQAHATVEALLAGAVSCVAKPSGAISLDLESIGHEIVREVRVAAASRPRAAAARPVAAKAKAAGGDCDLVVAVAASTGGPGALASFLGELPRLPGLALVIVQHMPVGFTRALAEHLDRHAAYAVREAADGDALQAGTALVAPAGSHAVVDGRGVVRLDGQSPPVHGVRPAADVTFRSLGALASRTAVVVLTGMGSDGAEGARLLAAHGALVLAQDADSAVVDGMPRAVRDLGLAARVGPPAQLAADVARWARAHGPHGERP
jgi:two-component system chemotaxis response regulator CheB